MKESEEYYSKQCVSNYLVRQHTIDESSAFTGEGTSTAHNSSESELGKFPLSPHQCHQT